MNTHSKFIRIAVLEDNLYYNKMLSEELKQHGSELSDKNNISILIDSFYTYSEFLLNFKSETNLAFVDFHMDEQRTALDVLPKIKATCFNCKVIVMSDAQNIWNMYLCLLEGASGIIVKDEMTISLCTYLIDQQFENAK